MSTVLVVDDTAVDRKLASRLLEKSGVVRVLDADGGQRALEIIAEQLPDVVVTDLQMPDMDGLQLVTAVQERFPEIPVVLMTAHGSEDNAALALEHGAVSFVPKSQLADLLVDTVTQVIALNEEEAQYDRLIGCSKRTEFEFELENDVELIEPLVDLLQQIATSMDVVRGMQRVRMGVALEHAVHNAMFRGNLEIPNSGPGPVDSELLQARYGDVRFRERRVRVVATITRESATFVISDDGPGFDTTIVPDVGDAESLTKEGRGLILMRHFFTDVQFNSAGNEVTLIQRRIGG